MERVFVPFDWGPKVDDIGKLWALARSGGYVMVWRPHSAPFVMTEKEWKKLPHASRRADGEER